MRTLSVEEATVWNALKYGRENGKTSTQLHREIGFNRRKICEAVEGLRYKRYPVGASRKNRYGYFRISNEEERQETVRQLRNQAQRELYLATIIENIDIEKEHDMKVLDQYKGDNFMLYHGDSCEVMQGLPDNSLDYSIFSPPFVDLYVYSDSDRDLGNCRTKQDFYDQFSIIVKELYRCIKPGRLVSMHCMDLPTSKWKDGFIGLSDFPGELTRLMQAHGFIYHSKITIWKDPVVQMQRTKALGLLHKQLKKDSTMSRQGVADYIITFRKEGDNAEPVTHTNDSFPVEMWQQYASPVWMDINQSNTLQRESARDERDEKHICPLQLDVIERCIKLWSNEGEIVFTPFLGIGSEVYQALRMKRKGIGIELKSSYFKQAVKNCIAAETMPEQIDLFEGMDI